MGLGSGRRINNNINNKQSDRTSSTAAGVEVAPFLKKTYEMVDDSSTDSIVSWSPNNKSFIVLDMPLFSTDLLPKYFKHNNFNSFVRQLNTYGFRKVSELWEFANDGFLRGHKHLLTTISRRKPAHSNPNTIQQSSSLKTKTKASCVVEIAGNFGIEQEVDRLKRDKNVLMQQLVRLRHQQQTTDNQLHGVGQRVQLMEQRQQQMMSFLAKAMHNPALLAQLSGVHNHPNHDRHISGVVNKKRRLPNHDEHPPHHPNNLNATATAALSDGHIIKYQPLINEAAKSMLRQILKMSAPLPDHSFKDPNAFLIDHLPTASAAASSVVDSANSAARFSEVTLSDVTHNSNHPCFPADTGSSVNHQPTLNPETLASSCVSSDSPNQVRSLEADVHTSLQEAIMSDFDDQMQGVQPESSLKFPDLSTSGTHNSVLSFLDSLSTVDNGTLLVETVMFAQDAELNAGILPGSNDAFWEQFFPVGPLPDAAEEVDSSAPEGSIPKDHELGSQDEALEELHHMSHLTEQMGLLSAEAGKV